jgi:outer membrane biosynthesis protein TonB
MIKRTCFVWCFIAAVCATIAAQSEPRLIALNMPYYPFMSRQGRAQGIVTVAFTLIPNAETPTKLEVVSAPPGTSEELKKTAIENVKTWKFENGSAVEHRYETTFEFHFGHNDMVSFKSFHYVTVIAGEPPIVAN